MRSNLELARRELEELGYRVTETPVHNPDGSPAWQVQADHREGRSILVRASTQSAAFEAVCRAAGITLKDEG